MDLGVSIWVLQHIPLLGVSLSGLYWHIWFGGLYRKNFWGFGVSPNELAWALGFAIYTGTTYRHLTLGASESSSYLFALFFLEQERIT